MPATSASQSRESSSCTEARETAAASGLPMNVGPCISAPDSAALTPAATAGVHSTAAMVRYPPVSALPRHMMSGVMPAWSQPKRRPDRPKPVAISSAISSTPCSSQSRRTAARYSGA